MPAGAHVDAAVLLVRVLQPKRRLLQLLALVRQVCLRLVELEALTAEPTAALHLPTLLQCAKVNRC